MTAHLSHYPGGTDMPIHPDEHTTSLPRYLRGYGADVDQWHADALAARACVDVGGVSAPRPIHRPLFATTIA